MTEFRKNHNSLKNLQLKQCYNNVPKFCFPGKHPNFRLLTNSKHIFKKNLNKRKTSLFLSIVIGHY